jgi:hypothetical protein
MVVDVEGTSTFTSLFSLSFFLPPKVAHSATGGAVIPVRLETRKSTNSEILKQIRGWLHNLLLLFHVSTIQSQ